jgi:hypothetical protein
VPGEQVSFPEMSFALALPVVGETFPDVLRWMRAKQCALVTTDGEFPYQDALKKNVAFYRRFIVTTLEVTPRHFFDSHAIEYHSKGCILSSAKRLHTGENAAYRNFGLKAPVFPSGG